MSRKDIEEESKQVAVKAKSHKDDIEQENKKAAVKAEAHADELLTMKKLCELLGVTSTTIWRKMSKHKFPKPKKLFGKNIWRRSVIDKYIEEQPEAVYPNPQYDYLRSKNRRPRKGDE
jgi:predicted DNA-binding transcriptional regulator AlpA